MSREIATAAWFHISLWLSRFFSASWKMVGTAVGFSSRCWSSSRREKLSLVKCSLQRNEYLVGVQLSL
uniref:Secreted protein n=2 Tax=Phasianinae TaxID=9072 RepID=A0A8V1A0W7_CHICK